MIATPLDGTAGNLICSACRHLAIAATVLANDHGLSDQDAEQYKAAAASFRDLAGIPWGIGGPGPNRAPFLTTGTGLRVDIVDLFASAYAHTQPTLRHKGVDREIVAQAVELLHAFKWQLPSDQP